MYRALLKSTVPVLQSRLNLNILHHLSVKSFRALYVCERERDHKSGCGNGCDDVKKSAIIKYVLKDTMTICKWKWSRWLNASVSALYLLLHERFIMAHMSSYCSAKAVLQMTRHECQRGNHSEHTRLDLFFVETDWRSYRLRPFSFNSYDDSFSYLTHC